MNAPWADSGPPALPAVKCRRQPSASCSRRPRASPLWVRSNPSRCSSVSALAQLLVRQRRLRFRPGVHGTARPVDQRAVLVAKPPSASSRRFNSATDRRRPPLALRLLQQGLIQDSERHARQRPHGPARHTGHPPLVQRLAQRSYGDATRGRSHLQIAQLGISRGRSSRHGNIKLFAANLAHVFGARDRIIDRFDSKFSARFSCSTSSSRSLWYHAGGVCLRVDRRPRMRPGGLRGRLHCAPPRGSPGLSPPRRRLLDELSDHDVLPVLGPPPSTGCDSALPSRCRRAPKSASLSPGQITRRGKLPARCRHVFTNACPPIAPLSASHCRNVAFGSRSTPPALLRRRRGRLVSSNLGSWPKGSSRPCPPASGNG